MKKKYYWIVGIVIIIAILSILLIALESCDFLRMLKDTQFNKLDFSCKTDADCVPIDCGTCAKNNLDIEKYEEIKNKCAIKGCIATSSCLSFECKCINNKCSGS